MNRQRRQRRLTFSSRECVLAEPPIGPEQLANKGKIIDAADHTCHCQRQQCQTKQQCTGIRHRWQRDQRESTEVSDKAHARQTEAQHAGCQHHAEGCQQNREQTEKQVGSHQPQPGEGARRLAADCGSLSNCAAKSSGLPSLAAISSST